jgi:hypothetical protein
MCNGRVWEFHWEKAQHNIILKPYRPTYPQSSINSIKLQRREWMPIQLSPFPLPTKLPHITCKIPKWNNCTKQIKHSIIKPNPKWYQIYNHSCAVDIKTNHYILSWTEKQKVKEVHKRDQKNYKRPTTT